MPSSSTSQTAHVRSVLLRCATASFSRMLPGVTDAAASGLCMSQVLGQLAPVPATFLKQLATDAELFDELPRSVQRQVRDCCQD